MKIYVASSWRNPQYPQVVEALRAAGHEVYDFRDANRSFNWAQIDPAWDAANPVLSRSDLKRALDAPQADVAFDHDHGALDWAEAGVLVMPCGRSAHLEAGYLRGRGRPVHILLADGERPDLMHKLAEVHTGLSTILPALRNADPRLSSARHAVETYTHLVQTWTAREQVHRDAGRQLMAERAQEALVQVKAGLETARQRLVEAEARLPLGPSEVLA